MSLPGLVEAYLARAVPGGARDVSRVRITQVGEMFTRSAGRAMRFTAVEDFAADRVAFAWEARFAIAPILTLRVRDGYLAGKGTLNVSALGFPVMRQAGASIDVGEVYRYLAELPWVPQAMAANDELAWREVDARTVAVSAAIGAEHHTVQFQFDPTGDITAAQTTARPGRVDGRDVTAGWGGRYSDYARIGGIRIPTRAEVYWDLEAGRFVYWRGRVTGVEMLDVPFGRPAEALHRRRKGARAIRRAGLTT